MVKFVKKAVRSGKRAVKSRYGIGKNRKLNTKNIVGDVMKLMTMVNAEKKIYQLPLQNLLVGQVSGNLTGTECFDCTPMMAQGADQFQRNGISLKLHSQLWQLQIFQQANANTANKFHIEFWYNNGMTRDQATILTDIYDPSIFSGVVDMTSTRNADHFKDYTKFYSRSYSIQADQLSGALTSRTFTIPIKFNKGKGRHIRYTGAGSTNYLTDVQAGQIVCIMRADNGNKDTSNLSTRPVAQTGVSTGLTIKVANRTWFYDN